MLNFNDPADSQIECKHCVDGYLITETQQNFITKKDETFYKCTRCEIEIIKESE